MKLSILTCVNDQTKYANCVMKTLMGIRKSGHEVDVQIFDNTGNKVIVPVALNRLIGIAESDLLVCIHQDVMLPSVWIDKLEEQIKEVEECWGPRWGVLGVAGVTMMGRAASHIVDPWHTKPTEGLPFEAQSLDEVCLIFRKSSGLIFDESLGGNHLYGADLCLEARQRLMPCIVIDDVLTHLSPGNITPDFAETLKRFQWKWNCIGYVDGVMTTCGGFDFRTTSLSE